MKAIILSAGQGRRLLPLTASLPKCLLNVAGRTILEWQVDTLQQAGIHDIVVVTGYGAEKVDRLINRYGQKRIRTLYNPRYATSDNLVSCWWAREEMEQDFLLLNGDTLFEAAVIKALLECPEAPITVTVSSKHRYDSDDMKVILEDRRLVHIGKKLPVENVHAESIGLIRFTGQGPEIFRNALEEAEAHPESSGRWYLSVIDTIAGEIDVMTCSITGLTWCEVDYPADLDHAGRIMAASTSLPHYCAKDPGTDHDVHSTLHHH